MKCCYWDKNNSAFVIERGKERYIFSYGTLVAKCKYEDETISNIVLGKDWNYSKTTVKDVCRFLGVDKKHLWKGIKSGTIKTKGVLK